ncbi:DMSO/selenate family reductase complex A subunit [Shewanella sp. 10N.286.45.A1]|uniref:DMSO/selenate family reductase complex A subunit n=1 Tax=Shewanella sp. 10N.286.45.A1 TaxID=3229694 RepID=UPI003552570A
MKRRTFLQATSALTAGAVLVGCGSDKKTLPVTSPDKGIDWTPIDPSIPVKPPVVEIPKPHGYSACLVNCGSNCPVKIFTNEDGTIRNVESDLNIEDKAGEIHQVRACARGRSLKQRTLAPDRIKRPMKRVGKRGSGEFVPISWEEAGAEIANKIQNIAQQYGNESILKLYGTGAYYSVKSSSWFNRILSLNGGYLRIQGNYSWQQLNYASKATGHYGTSGSTLNGIKNSDLFLGIGYNPSEMRQSGSGEGRDFLEALKANPSCKVIMVDPRYTDSCLGKEDEWHGIRPGTDSAFAEALMYEAISQGHVDQEFMDKHVSGFDKASLEALKKQLEGAGDELAQYVDPEENFHDYIMGVGKFAADGARTPDWAAKICGISADKIKHIASQLMGAANAFIVTGAGVNRHANGEQAMRSCYMLPWVFNQVGRLGTSNGAMPSQGRSGLSTQGISGLSNPVKTTICFYNWEEAIRNHKNMTGRTHDVGGLEDLDTPLKTGVKCIFALNSNALINQHSETSLTAKTLEDESLCEFIVVSDCWMTPSAKFADILLPDTSWLETDDFVSASYAAGNTGYVTAMKGVEPMWECRDYFQQGLVIAKAMGMEAEYTEGKTEEEWMEACYAAAIAKPANANSIPPMPPTFKEAQEIGIFHYANPEPVISMDSFISGGNPLSTPSGKLEMYSVNMAKFAVERTFNKSVQGDYVTALPKYQPTWGGYEDSSKDVDTDYPLQLVGYHTKGRTHSSYHNVPWLREAVEDAVWMNPVDAQERGLSDGDLVRVSSAYGTLEVPVKITIRVMPRVAALGQGAWYAPNLNRLDEQGRPIDEGGCLNTVTHYQPSPYAKGNPQHTNRVQVRRA